MKKKTFFVFQCKTEDGKMYAYADAVQNCNDLVSIFSHIRGLVTANACDTRKEADAIARDWNDAFRRKGTFAF